jgi:hypothetical protein
VVDFKVNSLICSPQRLTAGAKDYQNMENEVRERDRMEERRKKMYTLRRAILDYGMGVLLLAPRLGIGVTIDDTARYIFSGMFLIYGGFRIYRGSSKNYFD